MIQFEEPELDRDKPEEPVELMISKHLNSNE